jgi:hypothetical protein
MDVKLGTQLYGPDATPAKRAKMIMRATETTSANLGMKLCGLQVRLTLISAIIWCAQVDSRLTDV